MKQHPVANNETSSRIQIMTPPPLANQIVAYFNPSGRCLEPARGTGNIHSLLPPNSEWCEINEGRDFYQHTGTYDWIVTNPPFVKVRDWISHSISMAENVVLLLMQYHIMDAKTLRMLHNAGYGYREIIFCPTPRKVGFPGFPLGIVHIQRSWVADTKLTIW